MALTPTEVEGKTFGTALRGYDLDEVDDFLDDVVATLRDLQDQLAKARASQAESAAPPVVADESAVGRALIAAQAAGDTIVSDAREESERTLNDAREESERTLNDAREESERILNDARGEAETWATERDARKADADVEMAELTEHVSNVRTQLALLVTTVADRLDEMDLAIGGAVEPTATGEAAEEEDEADDLSDEDADVESFNLDDEEISDQTDDVASDGDEGRRIGEG